MKRTMSLILSLLLALSLVGCASRNTYSDEEEDGYESDGEETAYGPSTVSQSQAAQEGGVYVLRDGEFYPISGCELAYGAWTYGAVETFGVTRDDDSNIITVESGDQLVTFTAVRSYKFLEAYDEGYILPIRLVGVTGNGVEFSGGGPLLSCDYHSYTDEVEGVAVTSMDELEAVLEENGAFLFRDYDDYGYSDEYIGANQPMTLTGGYYKGTSFVEYNLVIDAKCYAFDRTYTAPVEETKEGYFIVDTSGLPSGRYVIEVGSNWSHKYVIDIA